MLNEGARSIPPVRDPRGSRNVMKKHRDLTELLASWRFSRTVSRVTRAGTRAPAVHWLAVLAALIVSCGDGVEPFFSRLVHARRLSAALLVDLAKASEASNLTVMADTAAAASKHARDAANHSQVLLREVDELNALLKGLAYTDELAALAEFERRFTKYVALDRSIVALSVEGSNLKAERLAFGVASEHADAFAVAVRRVAENAPSQLRWQATALSESAVSGLRETQVLLAPHIAAAEDAVMAGLEARIATADARAATALSALEAVRVHGAEQQVHDAEAALDRFMQVKREIIDLSRRNTNVRSLALALGQKRLLYAASEDSLRTLQQALLSKRDSPATR